jgi:hypothetical protein
MQTSNKQSQSRAQRAKSNLSCYHESIGVEEVILRKEIYFHLIVLVTTSPWWLAIQPDKRDGIIHKLVELHEKDDALDDLFR